MSLSDVITRPVGGGLLNGFTVIALSCRQVAGWSPAQGRVAAPLRAVLQVGMLGLVIAVVSRAGERLLRRRDRTLEIGAVRAEHERKALADTMGRHWMNSKLAPA